MTRNLFRFSGHLLITQEVSKSQYTTTQEKRGRITVTHVVYRLQSNSDYFTNNFRGKSQSNSTPDSVIKMLSVISMPQSSCQIPGIK